MRAWLVLAGTLLAATFAFAAPAAAGEADGCSWSVESLDRDGKVIDTAEGPGAGATKDDPLQIDTQGKIAYKGQTDEVIKNGSWNVQTSGVLAISFGGDVENDSGDTDKEGTESLADRLSVDAGPFGTIAVFNGLIHVDFEATGASGATCSAGGWLETTGSTFGSVPFIAGAISTVLGLGLVLLGWPVSSGAGMTAATGGTAPGGTAPGGSTPAEGAGPRPGPIGGGS